MHRTAQSIEEQKSAGEILESLAEESTGISQENSQRKNPASHLGPYQFKPGQSGNPDGRPKRDAAADIARGVFEEDPELIRQAMRKGLLKGNAYTFDVLSNRAYGKLKEKVEHSVSDELMNRLSVGRKRSIEE